MGTPGTNSRNGKIIEAGLATDSVEAAEEAGLEYVGDDHFLYASDVPHWDGEFPKNLKYLWNHPDLSRTTKEKIAYHNGKEYFGLNRAGSAPAARKAN